MVADIGFKKQLWALDPELDIVWNPKACKWEIWRFPGQKGKLRKFMDEKAKHMMTVQTENRSFRELGADILLQLQKYDPWRFSYKELCDYFDKMEDNLLRAKDQRIKDYFNNAHEETYWYTKAIRKPVPFSYNIKPSEKKLFIEGKPKNEYSKLLIKVPKRQKIQNAVRFENA